MKLSSSLLQAITLSVSVTALAVTTTSCEKENMERTQTEQTKDRVELPVVPSESDPGACPACGMG